LVLVAEYKDKLSKLIKYPDYDADNAPEKYLDVVPSNLSLDTKVPIEFYWELSSILREIQHQINTFIVLEDYDVKTKGTPDEELVKVQHTDLSESLVMRVAKALAPSQSRAF